MRRRSQKLQNLIIIVLLIIQIPGCSYYKQTNNQNNISKHQIQRSYFDNGNLEFEASYLNGKLNGTSKLWLEN